MEPTTFKVVVAGAFASGKTTLIRHITDGTFVGTEVPTSGPEASVKDTTTVGMEFGSHVVGDGDEAVALALYGVPGQERFRFMWDIVAEGLDGLLVLVDATAPDTWPDALAIGRHLHTVRPVPTVVGVGRTGGDPEVVAEVAAAVPLPGAVHMACDAIDADSARDAVVELLLLVLDELTPEAVA